MLAGVALLWWVQRLTDRVVDLRWDDILYVVLGMVPGAVVFGRLLHGLAFPDAYISNPGALFDLGRGSLSLLGAVVGGVISGAYVCRLLNQRVSPWADAAALPLLLAIGLGKLAMLLGGGGLGQPFEGPTAVALDGPGPWLATNAGLAAHPSAVYEGLLTLAGMPIIAWLAGHDWLKPAPRQFVAAVSWWLGARFLAGFTWRDETLLGPIGAEQLAALLALAALLIPLPQTRSQSPETAA